MTQSAQPTLIYPQEVKINLVDNETEIVLQRLFLHYFMDLSQFDPNIQLNCHGFPIYVEPGIVHDIDEFNTFDKFIQANWWIRNECERYLIVVEDNLAGFVILNRTGKFMATGIDSEVLDFYIVPKYQGRGVGRTAANLAFKLYPGWWQVYQLELNVGAIAFWNKIVNEATGGIYTVYDNGSQQRFHYPPTGDTYSNPMIDFVTF